jgi:hypothetical protein
VELQPIMAKALQGQKMVLQRSGGLGTGQKAWGGGEGGRDPETGSTGGQAPTKQAPWERAWVVKSQGLNKKSQLELNVGGLTWGCPQGVQSLEVA